MPCRDRGGALARGSARGSSAACGPRGARSILETTSVRSRQTIHQHLGQKEHERARKESSRQPPSSLTLKFGHEVRRGDIDGHASRKGEPVLDQKADLIRQDDSDEGGETEQRGCTDGAAATSASCQHDARYRNSLG